MSALLEERCQQDTRRAILWILLSLSLVRGLIYVYAVPPWGHYDEPTHFEYAWLVANRLSLPQREGHDERMRREVASSMIEHRFFRDIAIPRLVSADEPIWIGISELNHPPFYYLLIALPLRLLRHTGVSFQLYTGRLVSLLLYVTSVWIGSRVVGELVQPEHPLRWVVPTALTLLPAYTDLMTAINSDVAAVVLFSFFLWGGVRIIIHGLSAWRLVWVVGTAMLSAWTKNTASVAVVLLPIALALALFRRVWKWWLWAAVGAIGLLTLAVILTWGDAASWFRDTVQASATSREVSDAPYGGRALAVEVALGEPGSRVFEHLTVQEVESLRGETVTLGAWVWASQPVQARSPMLYDGERTTAAVLQLGIEPAYHAITATLSSTADRVGVYLQPAVEPDVQDGVTAYYDGVVLARGDRVGVPSFDDETASAGTWGGQPFHNLVRNGSAEVTGPRVRGWIERPMQEYTHRSPSQFLASLLDWQYTGWVHRITVERLLRSFWATFGWNSIQLPSGWYWVLGVLTAVGGVGAVLGIWQARRAAQSRSWRRAIGLLALAALLLWGNAFLRPHPVGPLPYLPVARYAYPAIVPTVLALAGGWWTLTPRRLRPWLPLGIALLLSVLDVTSLWTIVLSYYGRW